MKSTVFMFSGQGSHYRNMGREFYESSSIYREWLAKGDKIVQNLLQRSIITELYTERPVTEPFDDILVTNPAIFLVEYAIYQVLLKEGVKPDKVLGSSVGEYAAAVVAGIWSFETALTTIIEQAKQLVVHCEPGGMTAVLDDPSRYQELEHLQDKVSLAGINYPLHFTISGSKTELSVAEDYLVSKQVSYQRLPVSYAFHSSNIEKAKLEFSRYCQTLPPLKTPEIPYMSGIKAEFLKTPHQNYFWDVIRYPLKFRENLHLFEEQGDNIYLDLGPQGTLANFVKRNISAQTQSIYAILTPFHQGVAAITKIKEEVFNAT
ncbi:MAG: acyltransferase domain-containing protein [Planctomycetes bacterium]|nr:acyltransferase domain-containing protein [Planctomycetota bacterium]